MRAASKLCLILVAVFAFGHLQCVTVPNVGTSAEVPTVAPAPAPAPAAAWSAESKAALKELCEYIYQGKWHGGEVCACLVTESEKRISEDAFREWFASNGKLRADEVAPEGNRIEAECRVAVGSI